MKLYELQQTSDFLNYLDQWMLDLKEAKLTDLSADFSDVALISVDLIKGFCDFGPLESPRVADIVAPTIDLMKKYWQMGGRNILLSQDAHDAQAVEFAAWPSHCVRGSTEAETVDAIRSLPFFDQILLMNKNSISSGLNQEFGLWIDSHPQVNMYIVVGDCTDLCTYQLAMFLRLSANEHQIPRRILIPANCVATYDLSVENATKIGTLPHPAELLDAIFLYHMALNGIEIVKEIQ